MTRFEALGQTRRARQIANPQAAAIKDFHNLRPIPQKQIDLTDGGNVAFPQNLGY